MSARQERRRPFTDLEARQNSIIDAAILVLTNAHNPWSIERLENAARQYIDLLNWEAQSKRRVRR